LKKATGLLCVDFQVPTFVFASTLLAERFNADDFSITDVGPAYENSWLLKKLGQDGFGARRMTSMK